MSLVGVARGRRHVQKRGFCLHSAFRKRFSRYGLVAEAIPPGRKDRLDVIHPGLPADNPELGSIIDPRSAVRPLPTRSLQLRAETGASGGNPHRTEPRIMDVLRFSR